jgi:hypothetical protein
VSIQVTPGTPQPVVQAAIAAINAHLRRHGRDLVEVSVSPQASLDSSGRPAVGAQAQAEIHVTASASLTVASSVSAAPGGGEVDPGSLRLNRPGAAVDLTWSPVSIGVLYHLDAQDRRPDSGPQPDYEALRSDARIINWVVGQLDRADFTSPGAGELDVSTFVTQLLDAMRRAGGEEAQWNIHIGALQVADFPSGLTRGLTRAAQLVAVASPDVAGVRRVRVSVLNLPRDGNGPERVARWMLLQLDREAVTPAAAPPAR